MYTDLCLKQGFQNHILSHNALCGSVVNSACASGRDKRKTCLHTRLLAEDVKVLQCCAVYNKLHDHKDL